MEASPHNANNARGYIPELEIEPHRARLVLELEIDLTTRAFMDCPPIRNKRVEEVRGRAK
jgi:hypothetical protein